MFGTQSSADGSHCFDILTKIGLAVRVESFWVFLILSVEGIALWKVELWIGEVASLLQTFNNLFILSYWLRIL